MTKSDEWPPFAFAPSSPWGRCYSDFLRRKFDRSGSQSTLDHYRQYLVQFFTEPALIPDAYTREHVEAFVHSPGRGPGREGNPPSVGLMNNRLSVLNSFYAYAGGYGITNEQGIIEPLMKRMSPTAGLKQMQREQGPYRALSAEELRRFFDAIPRDTIIGIRDYALFATYFFTARRRSEIVNLKWGDIEKTTLIEANGGRRPGWLYHYRAKGHKRQDATAELPQVAMEAIVLYLEKSGRLATIKPEDYIFIMADRRYKPDAKKPLHPNTVWHAVKVSAARAGIPQGKITTHSLRHTSARVRYESGVDIREIQRILGHANLSVTDTYLRQLTTTADPGAKFLEKKFGDF